MDLVYILVVTVGCSQVLIPLTVVNSDSCNAGQERGQLNCCSPSGTLSGVGQNILQEPQQSTKPPTLILLFVC